LAQIVDAAVINAGDGTREHPTQALLGALTIKRRRGRIAGQTVAICGDITHSRAARSNIHLVTTMGARIRVVGPPTLRWSIRSRRGSAGSWRLSVIQKRAYETADMPSILAGTIASRQVSTLTE
jgi:aspartate carbamoyltransferase catalytic subunit